MEYKPDKFIGFNHGAKSLITYMLIIAAFDFANPRDKTHIIVNPPSYFQILISLWGGIFTYDFIFFWIHLALHKFS
jgi:hypothetical protein